MLSTYLNNNLASPYPFESNTAYPFPDNMFIGASITVVYTDISKYSGLYISNITINNNACFVTLMHNNAVVGVFESADIEANPVCMLTQYDVSSISVYGFLFIGEIPKDTNASYTGEFVLDPSCISFISADMISKYDTYTVNGESFKTPQLFNIDVSGLLDVAIESDKVILTGENASSLTEIDALFELPSVIDTLDVLSVNNIQAGSSAGTSTGTTLHIGTTATGITIESNSENASVIVVTITGGSSFPNCYKGKGDDAGVPRD